MEKFVIHGGKPLHGTVQISGAKNAAVALVAATILCDEPCVLENVPEISDITKCMKILREMGAEVRLLDKNTIYFDTKGIEKPEVPYELARTMRASCYFLGTLLGRFHEAFVPMPGGCDLGDRPIDQHLKAFKALGASDEIVNGANHVTADELVGNQIYFDFVTVGATMNAIFASVKAKGLTIIENAAKEPHIVDLANFLNSMGADIRGAGTDVIKIRGVDYLKGVTYATIPDQIEAGTYMVAAAARFSFARIVSVSSRFRRAARSSCMNLPAIYNSSSRMCGSSFFCRSRSVVRSAPAAAMTHGIFARPSASGDCPNCAVTAASHSAESNCASVPMFTQVWKRSRRKSASAPSSAAVPPRRASDGRKLPSSFCASCMASAPETCVALNAPVDTSQKHRPYVPAAP